MRHLIYSVRQRFSTIAVSVCVGLLMGGGAVYAAETIDGHDIKTATISEFKLGTGLQAKIDGAQTAEDVFKVQSELQVEMRRLDRQVYTEISEEFVRKEPLEGP